MRDRYEDEATRWRARGDDPETRRGEWRRLDEERRYPSPEPWRGDQRSEDERDVTAQPRTGGRHFGQPQSWQSDEQWREPDYNEAAPPRGADYGAVRRPLAERYGRGEFSVEGYDERYGSGFGRYRSRPLESRPRHGLEDGGYEQSCAGRGPRDYERSDEHIREDVCDRLGDDSVVDASDVSVRVENGEVTLEGSVQFRRMKRRAEDIAEGVRGVNDVHDRLRVKKGVLAEVSERLTGREDRQDYHGQQVRSSSVTTTVSAHGGITRSS